MRNRHDKSEHVDAAQNEDGLMVEDNVYGQINDDARRRDFTINALYTTDGFKLLDFCNALSDLKTSDQNDRRPSERYREDGSNAQSPQIFGKAGF